MIASQIFIWVMFSLASGMVTYYVLTEGKNNFLFILTFFFSLFFGISTSYIWLQTTSGLAAYSWGLFVLPVLLTFVATMVLLSFYVYYHENKVLPRVPRFSKSKTTSTISIAIIFLLTFLLASAYQVPYDVDEASVSVLGSTPTETLTESDVIITDYSTEELTIQTSVVSPVILRDEPMVGDSLNFKVEFMPTLYYADPSLSIFVQDRNGNLIPEADIMLTRVRNNVVEGRILCNDPGTYEIYALVYDLSISSTVPLLSETHSFSVYSIPEFDVGRTIPILLFVFILMAFVVFMACVIGFKKHN